MTQRDYYEILGVGRNASADELKSAYRSLARKYHPDINKEPGAEEHFKEVNEAFAVLNDPDKRAAYDRYGHAGVQGMGGAPDFTNIDFSEIFEDFFGFGGFRGAGRSRRPNAPKRGSDLSQAVNLTFSEAFFGVEKEIEITRDEICGTCHGKGSEPGTNTSKCAQCDGRGEIRQTRQTFLGAMVQVIICPACKGTGEIITTPCHTCKGRGIDRKTNRKVVPVPAGVDNGTQIRLGGEGNTGLNGGPNGNLYLELRVKPHEFFKRKDNDLLLDLNINVAQATLGAEINIPTMEGTHKLDIPPGTQSGKVFRIRGKGFADMRGGTNRGDLVSIINVEVPTHLNAEQRELFEKLAQTLGTEVKPQGKGFLDAIKEVFGG